MTSNTTRPRTMEPIDEADLKARNIRKATQKNEHGGSSVIAALIANFLVFLFKLIAALIGKSSSMLAESVHSFADCGNELMLIFGKRFRKSMILMSAIPKAGQTFVMFPA